MRHKIIFGLGSNLGDRKFNLDCASTFLQQKLQLMELRKSTIFKNPALLKENSPKEWDIEFFNIALSARINLEQFPPQKILEVIKEIENELGRKPDAKWSPRPIDIDILIIEGTKIDLKDELVIPHYDLQNRDFFLVTMEEIEPKWRELMQLRIKN